MTRRRRRLLRRLGEVLGVAAGVFSVGTFVLWGCFASTPSLRPVVPTTYVDSSGERHDAIGAVVAGPYLGIGGGLAASFVLAPIDGLEVGAGAGAGGGLIGVVATGTAFARWRFDVTRRLSLVPQLSLDAAFSPYLPTVGAFGPSYFVGGAVALPVVVRLDGWALYGALSAGAMGRYVDLGWAQAWLPSPDVRAAAGAVVGDGPLFFLTEVGASTSPYVFPVPYAWFGVGLRF